MSENLASPYDAPELYDLVLDHFHDDLPFWLEEAGAGGGPFLEVACGTGRVMLHLRERGFDADGLDLSAPMIARLHAKAAARGLVVTAVIADMRDFTVPRRYARVAIPFNGFAHCETIADQVRCLRCCHQHLERGGALVIHMSYPGESYWNEPDVDRVLEREVAHPETGHPVRMYDTRRKDPAQQRQDSIIDIEELDGAGKVVRAHRSNTSQRWVYRFEFELLLRAAGFWRVEILGGFDRRPLEKDTDQMVAFAWRD